jgi:hypothetical protein
MSERGQKRQLKRHERRSNLQARARVEKVNKKTVKKDILTIVRMLQNDEKVKILRGLRDCFVNYRGSNG